MTNGNERLDRIERILEQVSNSLQETAGRQDQVTSSFQEMAGRQDQVTSTLQAMAGWHDQVTNDLQQVAKRLQEMAARQQYHDEAFERHDAEMKVIREAIDADAENIRALVRVAELHHRRLEDLEGGGAV